MGLTLIHAADLHLDSPFASFPEEQREILRSAQASIPQRLEGCCREQGAQMLLLAGDVFDGPYRWETARELSDCLEDCGIPVFISPGNHDFLGPDSPWDREFWPDNVHIFRGNLSYVDLPELDCRVYGGGYSSMDCRGLLEGFQAERVYAHTIALLHGDTTSPKSPYCPITTVQIGQSHLDYLALGHIHQAGSLHAGQTLCAWPGCPMGRGWDETGAKGVLRVNLDARARVSPIPLGLPRFYSESVSLEEGLSGLERLLPAMKSQDFYRITLTGSGEADIPALQKKYGSLAHVEFRNRMRPRTSLWETAGQDSFQGMFFDLLKQALDQASPQDGERIRLAAEISRRLLDGEEVALP